MLRGGYEAFSAEYGCMCQMTIISSETTRSRIVAYPSEVEHKSVGV